MDEDMVIRAAPLPDEARDALSESQVKVVALQDALFRIINGAKKLTPGSAVAEVDIDLLDSARKLLS